MIKEIKFKTYKTDKNFIYLLIDKKVKINDVLKIVNKHNECVTAYQHYNKVNKKSNITKEYISIYELKDDYERRLYDILEVQLLPKEDINYILKDLYKLFCDNLGFPEKSYIVRLYKKSHKGKEYKVINPGFKNTVNELFDIYSK